MHTPSSNPSPPRFRISHGFVGAMALVLTVLAGCSAGYDVYVPTRSTTA